MRQKINEVDLSALGGSNFKPGFLVLKFESGLLTATTTPALPVRKNPGDEKRPQVYEYKGKPKDIAQVLLK